MSTYARVVRKLLLFVVGLVVLDHGVVAPLLRPLLYEYRKPVDSSTYHFALGQLARVEHLTTLPGGSKCLFVGSSSVVNGVDSSILSNIWQRRGVGLVPVNCGVTSFLASELPFFRRYTTRPDIAGVVYMYNTFSFAEGLHPEGTRIAWDTLELLHYATPAEVVANLTTVIGGSLADVFYTVRFRDLIRHTFDRWLAGKLTPPHNDFDYPLNEPVVEKRRLKAEPLLDASDWLRMIYLTSDTDEATLGYRGLGRFLEVMARYRIPVVVMPAPEPAFASQTIYRRGIQVARIDAHVRHICEQHGVICLPRSEVAPLEREDRWFRDHVHLHRIGRNRFSRWLADRIPALLGSAAPQAGTPKSVSQSPPGTD
jgi:hypothetical protein